MLYGVPYELFWHLNPRKLEPFKTAYQKKLEIDNQNAWLQGQYIRLAVGSVLDGKKCKYPKEPFNTGDDGDKVSAEADFMDWIAAFNAGFEAKTDNL